MAGILSLTLNWASTDSLCAEPITTKYAGDVAYLTAAFMRQDGSFRLHPVLERRPGSSDRSGYLQLSVRGTVFSLAAHRIGARSISSRSSRIQPRSATFSSPTDRNDRPRWRASLARQAERDDALVLAFITVSDCALADFGVLSAAESNRPTLVRST